MAISLFKVFERDRLRFMEIPQRMAQFLLQPDPIEFTHLITVNVPEEKKTLCYDIDVEIVSV